MTWHMKCNDDDCKLQFVIQLYSIIQLRTTLMHALNVYYNLKSFDIFKKNVRSCALSSIELLSYSI